MPDPSDLRRALRRIRAATGLPVAFGGLSGPHGFRITETAGTVTQALTGLAISAGSGVGGKAAVLGRPVSVSDYRRSRTISHEYDTAVAAEGLHSVLAVPVVVRRRVRAVLYAALRQPLSLGDRSLTVAQDAARELERDIADRDEAARPPAAGAGDGPDPEWGERGAPPAAWEEVRTAHADLRALAGRVPDAALRADLLSACARLETAWSPATPAAAALLTPRETDVLACVATGATNCAVAARLGVRPETVKAYLRSAMRKLGAHTRLEAVVAARRAGLLP
ncbi:LuxR C-terminal-related transcriptional regulator [Streptomyces sp. SL13]|uniref:LuxR C-terminal-related transcriptional regulator n=1 Tax=Streptantibioticus silvisoli TaxID=2705255 RepID=A0AA90H0F0_9ACTN|nr:LuxR family transcriptional regulator [Streptantibioticus silvisoli]MDI5971703.1 LuxR C-terminal-related transcriptional regulator [Streptantibioticus silvisoli]